VRADPTGGAAADTTLPAPEDFDDATRRPGALERARLVLNAERLPGRVRARAAALLGDHALTVQRDRGLALEYYQVALRLNPVSTAYDRMVRQLRDSVPL
jgi:hypothetical protein